MHGRNRDLRKGRYSSVGYTYHIVFSTHLRAPIFENFDSARLMIRTLRNSDDKGLSNTLCFVVMPDHVHWLFELKKESISRCVQRVKAECSRTLGIKCWNRGFYDHGIRSEENLVAVARYIVANPLRAKMVTNVGDYPHWDSIWL